MPVSIDGAGSGFRVPSGCRSNSMKTLFQIFDVPLALAGDAEAHGLGARQVVSAEVVNLRAPSARSRVAHLPEVVRTEFADPSGRQVLLPDFVRIVVAGDEGDLSQLKIVACSRSGGSFHTAVSSSHANRIASVLK